MTGLVDDTPYHLKIKCRVLDYHYVSLKNKWNLISISCYENISKTNIIVRNNSVEYSWADAVSEGIILNFLHKWNQTTGYNIANTLEPGKGYWMYAYYKCTLKK
ncbi:MAG: hypothetical protein JSW60_08075 [Thermoplasmatales archaeon]|nr:MAG: hypothetical protein JSW60_08075 [Thermoplasmatales archaeon]